MRKKPGRRSHRKAGERDDLVRVGGLPAVAALFARSPERVERLFFLEERRRDVEEFCRVLARGRKPFRQVGADELARVAGSVLHGGVVAVAQPQPVRAFDPAAAADWGSTTPLLLVLDGIGNPHNLGAIVRSAAFFGLDRIVLSGRADQAGPSNAAHRVAEGGLEYVQLYRADRLPEALRHLKRSYRIVGTALGRGGTLDRVLRDRPIALVLGNEEHGLDAATLAACDDIVTIGGSGWVQSLNVAATAAILIHALLPRGPAAGL
jgi:TrmH RNA methyltransferase